MSAILHIEKLKICAGKTDRILIDGFSTEIDAGKLVALTGLNGSGKSTLLFALAGLNEWNSGNIQISGMNWRESSAAEKSKLASMVFTSQENIPWMNVRSFIATGRLPYSNFFGRSEEKDEQMIDEAIAAVGLEDFTTRYIADLSDGEKQRCLIARALAQDTPLILLDEPTAFLDVQHKRRMLETMKKIAIERNKTVIFSTHDIHLAKKHADQFWLIRNRNVEILKPDEMSEELFQ